MTHIISVLETYDDKFSQNFLVDIDLLDLNDPEEALVHAAIIAGQKEVQFVPILVGHLERYEEVIVSPPCMVSGMSELMQDGHI